MSIPQPPELQGAALGSPPEYLSCHLPRNPSSLSPGDDWEMGGQFHWSLSSSPRQSQAQPAIPRGASIRGPERRHVRAPFSPQRIQGQGDLSPLPPAPGTLGEKGHSAEKLSPSKLYRKTNCPELANWACLFVAMLGFFVCFFFFEKFTLYKMHDFKMCSLVGLSTFTRLCHHHCVAPEYFHRPQKQQSPPIPPSLQPLLFVSEFASFRDFIHMELYNMLSFVLGCFYLGQCLLGSPLVSHVSFHN